jgi:hypothetical protein
MHKSIVAINRAPVGPSDVLRDSTHGSTASQIMFASLGLRGPLFSVLLLRADRREGVRLEHAKRCSLERPLALP